MIIRTEAVVLRTLKYGETSLIATLFTREMGKVAVIAKGARRTKSKFGSTLQPMSYTQVVFYYKPTRSLQTLSESAHVRAFHNIGRSLKKLALGQRMMEMTAALIQEEEANPHVFNLLVQTLRRLDEAERRIENILPYFELRLASLLGFSPAVERDAVANLSGDGGLLDLETGAVLSLEGEPGAARRASRSVLRAYAVFARAELDVVMRMRLRSQVRRGVQRLIDAYLRYQFGNSYPSKGEAVMGQLLQHPAEKKGFSEESP